MEVFTSLLAGVGAVAAGSILTIVVIRSILRFWPVSMTWSRYLISSSSVELWNELRLERPEWRPRISEAELARVSLVSINLRRAILVGVKIEDSDLAYADLTGARFIDSVFRNVSIDYATLIGTHFIDTVVENLSGVATATYSGVRVDGEDVSVSHFLPDDAGMQSLFSDSVGAEDSGDYLQLSNVPDLRQEALDAILESGEEEPVLEPWQLEAVATKIADESGFVLSRAGLPSAGKTPTWLRGSPVAKYECLLESGDSIRSNRKYAAAMAFCRPGDRLNVARVQSLRSRRGWLSQGPMVVFTNGRATTEAQSVAKKCGMLLVDLNDLLLSAKGKTELLTKRFLKLGKRKMQRRLLGLLHVHW